MYNFIFSSYTCIVLFVFVRYISIHHSYTFCIFPVSQPSFEYMFAFFIIPWMSFELHFFQVAVQHHQLPFSCASRKRRQANSWPFGRQHDFFVFDTGKK